MTIKKHHLAITVLILVGALYVFHMWNTHGTFKQTLSGIGINR
jgi:hypothetical protein